MEPYATTMSASRKKLSAAAQHRKHQRNIGRDIDRMQRRTEPFIPLTSFSRLVHEIVGEQGDFCVRSDAVRALQTAAEDYVTTMFASANRIAQYTGRETVSSEDLKFVTPERCMEEDELSLDGDGALALQLPVPDL
jgi:histone H3/H4